MPLKAEYKDRLGNVVQPSENSVFKNRYGAFIICFVGDHMLLSRAPDSNGDWELPGGGIEDGENPKVAVLRELYEETGIYIEDAPIKKIYNHQLYHYAQNTGYFLNYEQDYYILDDPSYSDHIFEGIKKSPDNCDAKWILRRDLDKTPIRYDHSIALKALELRT